MLPAMGEVERRASVRVPARGVTVCYGGTAPVRGTIENLSSTGALVTFDHAPSSSDLDLDLELKLGTASARISARVVRSEGKRIGLSFDDLDPAVRDAIDTAIDSALVAAARRPVLVIDDNVKRRASLLALLETQGMTPIAPRTPLDAIDLLTNGYLAVSVALLAPSFGHSLEALEHLVSDSFPWVRAAEISDDVQATVQRAQHAWSGTDIARLARAIA